MTVDRGPDPWAERWAEWHRQEQERKMRSGMAGQDALAYITEAKKAISHEVRAPEAQPVDLSTIDEAWMKRLLFVMYRRPDAVATR